jgi:hypothetical protein
VPPNLRALQYFGKVGLQVTLSIAERKGQIAVNVVQDDKLEEQSGVHHAEMEIIKERLQFAYEDVRLASVGIQVHLLGSRIWILGNL